MLARLSLRQGCWAAALGASSRAREGEWGCFDGPGSAGEAVGGQAPAGREAKRRASSEIREITPAKPKVAVGDVHERQVRFSYGQVREFALLTGDTNPIHATSSGTEAEAQGTCIVPGILCASLFPTIIGSTFPGTPHAACSLPPSLHRNSIHLSSPQRRLIEVDP